MNGGTCTMTIKVSSYNGAPPPISTTVITIVSPSSVNLSYIPFAAIGTYYGYSRLPTGVTSFNMTGPTPTVLIGNQIDISLTGSFTAMINASSQLVGTLLTNNTFSAFPYNWTFNAPAFGILYGTTNKNLFYNDWVLVSYLQPGSNNGYNSYMNMYYSISGGAINNGLMITGISMNIQSSAPITNTTLTFNVHSSSTANGNSPATLKTATIVFTTITLSNNITIMVPFDMPLPGAPYSQEQSGTYGY